MIKSFYTCFDFAALFRSWLSRFFSSFCLFFRYLVANRADAHVILLLKLLQLRRSEQTHFKQSENHEAHSCRINVCHWCVHIAIAICKTGTKKFLRNNQTFRENTFAIEKREKKKWKWELKQDLGTKSIECNGVWVRAEKSRKCRSTGPHSLC